MFVFIYLSYISYVDTVSILVGRVCDCISAVHRDFHSPNIHQLHLITVLLYSPQTRNSLYYILLGFLPVLIIGT
jgi:hypothetical protein